jgi:hypothetical protein
MGRLSLPGIFVGPRFRQPSRILATPEFKINPRHRTELKANSFSAGLRADFDAKFLQYSRGFSFGTSFSRHRGF